MPVIDGTDLSISIAVAESSAYALACSSLGKINSSNAFCRKQICWFMLNGEHFSRIGFVGKFVYVTRLQSGQLRAWLWPAKQGWHVCTLIDPTTGQITFTRNPNLGRIGLGEVKNMRDETVLLAPLWLPTSTLRKMTQMWFNNTSVALGKAAQANKTIP